MIRHRINYVNIDIKKENRPDFLCAHYASGKLQECAYYYLVLTGEIR